MKRALVVALFPLALGLLGAAVLVNGWLGNPVLFLRVDLGTLALLVGGLGSLMLGVALALQLRVRQARRRLRLELQAEAAADRRRFLSRLDHELKNPLTAIRAALANLAAEILRSTQNDRALGDNPLSDSALSGNALNDRALSDNALNDRALSDNALGDNALGGGAGGVGDRPPKAQAAVPVAEAQRAALASVEAQALRLSRLTADLRKLAELEMRPLELAPVDLSELLPEAVALAQEQPHAAGRQLTLTLPQAPWPVPAISGDRDLLFLAVHNLLENALKFSRDKDTIEVRAFEDGASVVVTVADTGPGIPEDEAQHVWEELYRGQGARGVAGSGLGLPLVRAIVERHGGQVSLRSRAGRDQAGGTVVSLRLPIGGS